MHWHTAMEHLKTGLFIFQLTMIGYFTYLWSSTSKEDVHDRPLLHTVPLLPLPFVTIFYHLYRRDRFYHRFLPLEDGEEVDHDNAKPKAKYIQPKPETSNSKP